MTIPDLKSILVDQQAELASITANLVEREQSKQLRDFLDSQLVKVVKGVRRSGKSTLCLSILSPDKIAYANFDDERLITLTAADLNAIYQQLLQLKPKAEIFVFDEIQNVSGWELFVNRLQRKKLNILITGSNGRLLSRDLASHLTGRQLSLELMPFSFSEYLRFNNISLSAEETTERRATLQGQFEAYFNSGGFPEVLRGEPLGPYLRELFDKIVSRDIAQRYDLRGIKPLKELGLYLIQNSGCLTSLQSLFKTFQFRSINTVKKYVEYLQDCYLLYDLSAYSHKLKERSTAPKKNYACDVGLISALSAKPTPDLGARLETLVYLHLRRRYLQLHYWRHKQHEVDFAVVENRKVMSLIQVCYDLNTEKTKRREVAALAEACHQHKLDRGQIVTWGEEGALKEENIVIEIIPAWKFCLRDFDH